MGVQFSLGRQASRDRAVAALAGRIKACKLKAQFGRFLRARSGLRLLFFRNTH